MDSSIEDRMYHQIENSLSNKHEGDLDISSDLFINSSNGLVAAVEETGGFAKLSRAEYIRQAREACLRQMNTVQTDIKAYDNYITDKDTQHNDDIELKKHKELKLFEEGKDADGSARELTDFRFLIIRTVCAIVIFISIFLIDRFKLKLGIVSYEMIREYVTGKDTLRHLENLIITWLK